MKYLIIFRNSIYYSYIIINENKIYSKTSQKKKLGNREEYTKVFKKINNTINRIIFYHLRLKENRKRYRKTKKKHRIKNMK